MEMIPHLVLVKYLSHFNMVEPFYSFDYKNIHFVVMSTGLNSLVPYDEESPQYEFCKIRFGTSIY